MSHQINGRTPEEIKRGLECYNCKTCPYKKENCGDVDRDALAYIQQLERERDAAIHDLKTKCYYCETCVHYRPGYFCPGCRSKSNYEWRGLQEVE